MAGVWPRNSAPVAAVVAGLVLAACGGGEDEKAPKAAPPLGATPKVTTLETTAPAGAPKPVAKGQPADEVPAVPPPRTYAVSPLAQVERRALRRLREYRTAVKARKKLTAEQQMRAQLGAARDLTEAVMIAAGLEFATFDLADGGRKVTVNVDRKSACTLQASEPDAIEQRIVGDSDIVEQVKLRVEGSKLGLERYLKRNCDAKKPAGVGKVVFEKSGTGAEETQPIRIKGRSWRIAFDSSSALLQVYVYRGGKLQRLAVNRRARGAGNSQVLKGPGRYTLRVAATGHWTLRVLDTVGTG
jgi:hypothetical protein